MTKALDEKFDEMFKRGRKFFVREDYERMAEKTNLTYIGRDKLGLDKSAPVSVADPCWWQCNECLFVAKKTYRAVRKAFQQGTPSCYCHHYAYSREAYEFAGSLLGFTLVGVKPRNNKIKTQWLDFYGNPLEASFVEITNNPKRVPLKRFIGRTKPEVLVNGIATGPKEWKKMYGVDLLPDRNHFDK